jgi:hypothetical protein
MFPRILTKFIALDPRAIQLAMRYEFPHLMINSNRGTSQKGTSVIRYALTDGRHLHWLAVANYSTSRKHDGVRAKSTRGGPEYARASEDVRGGGSNVPAMSTAVRPGRWNARHRRCAHLHSVDGSVDKTDSMRRDFRGRQRRNEGKTQRKSAGSHERTAQESGDANVQAHRARECMMHLRTPGIGVRSGRCKVCILMSRDANGTHRACLHTAASISTRSCRRT